MQLESIKVDINNSAEYIFEKLIQVASFEKLMPENKSKFEVLNDSSFVFALQGMPEITLRLKDKAPNSKIIYESANPKMEFQLTIHITETSENQCQTFYVFDGNFNAMIAMMIKNPISKFIETLAIQTNSL